MSIKRVMGVLFLLYVVALHTSMAGLEVFSGALILFGYGYQLRYRHFEILRANRGLVMWLVGMVLAVLVSLLINPIEKPFLYQFGFMRWTILLWGLVFVLQEIWSPAFEKKLLYVWMVALSVAGVYGVVQCLTGVDFIRHREDILASQGDVYRAVGFFNVSLTYAYVMGMSAFALAWPGYRSKNRSFALAASAFGLLGMLASTSRGSWVAAVLTLLFFLWFAQRRLLIPGVAMLSMIVAALAYFSSAFGGKIMGLITMSVDHSSALRFDIWRGYWGMFMDHPIFGIGLLEGDILLPAYYAKLGITQPFVSHAHNNILQWLAGAGVLGFVCYLAVVGIFLVKAWNLRLKNAAWGWSLLCAQLFFHIGGLTEANFIAALANHFLIFLWALILVIESRSSQAEVV